MEHVPGGSYTNVRKPCRCTDCRARHAAHQRDYSKRHRRPSIGKLNAELMELRAFKAGVLAAQAAQATQLRQTG